jgi:hypothetical protein
MDGSLDSTKLLKKRLKRELKGLKQNSDGVFTKTNDTPDIVIEYDIARASHILVKTEEEVWSSSSAPLSLPCFLTVLLSCYSVLRSRRKLMMVQTLERSLKFIPTALPATRAATWVSLVGGRWLQSSSR